MNNQYLTDTNLLQKDNDHLVHILLNPPRHYQLKRGGGCPSHQMYISYV